MPGRISLYDCGVELRIPSLGSFSGDENASLEDITSQLAESGARELNEIYVGETVFVIVAVRGPSAYSHSRESLFYSLEKLSTVQVFLSSPEEAPDAVSRENSLSRSLRLKSLSSQSIAGHPPAHSQSLPVLKESDWVFIETSSTDAQTPESAAARFSSNPEVFCKGLWVLIRTPPEVSDLADVLSIAGKQSLSVTLKQRSVPNDSTLLRVSAAISRASRMFEKSPSLAASKALTIKLPLDISIQNITAGGSARSFVCISTSNNTEDASLSVVPPFIHLSATQILTEGGELDRLPALDDGPASLGYPNGVDLNTGTYLEESYSFNPIFKTNDNEIADNDAKLEGDCTNRSAHSESLEAIASSSFDQSIPSEEHTEHIASVSGSKKSISEAEENNSYDDLGLFFPSFRKSQKNAITLGPREVYNFVYEIVPKGYSQEEQKHSSNARKSDDVQTSPDKLLPKLLPGESLETPVAIAWSCNPRDTSIAAQHVLSERSALERAFSSGGVLAIGSRSNFALRLSSVQWRPPALIQDIILSFSGPSTAIIRSQIVVTICVLNQSVEDLTEATLHVQDDMSNCDPRRLLTPLRTVVPLGEIPAGKSARVELFCVALYNGVLSLGSVKVSEGGSSERQRAVTAWNVESSFEIYVTDVVSNGGDHQTREAQESSKS